VTWPDFLLGDTTSCHATFLWPKTTITIHYGVNCSDALVLLLFSTVLWWALNDHRYHVYILISQKHQTAQWKWNQEIPWLFPTALSVTSFVIVIIIIIATVSISFIVWRVRTCLTWGPLGTHRPRPTHIRSINWTVSIHTTPTLAIHLILASINRSLSMTLLFLWVSAKLFCFVLSEALMWDQDWIGADLPPPSLASYQINQSNP